MSLSPLYKYCNYTFEDRFNVPVLTDQIVYDTQGIVSARLHDMDNYNFYTEEIGRVDMAHGSDRVKIIAEIAQKHIQEIMETLRQVEGLEMTIQGAVECGVFSALRESCLEAKRKEAEKQDKLQSFGWFLDVVGQSMKFNHFIRLNAFGSEESDSSISTEPCWYPVAVTGESGVIRDKEVSLEASFARLLLVNPYSQIPYPSLFDLLERFFEARKTRLSFINGLLAGMAVVNNGVQVQDYELYSDDVLVFKKEGATLHIYREQLFRELCQVPENGRGLKAVIDEAFVLNALEKEHVPADAERKLRRFIGHTIGNAINLEARLYGNLKRVQEIHREEIDDLDGEDRFLYDSIYYICDQRQDEARGNARLGLKCSPLTWDKLKERYRYLRGAEGLSEAEIHQRAWWPGFVGKDHKEPAWDKLETIYHYLSGRNENGAVTLRSETAPDLLRIIKMFDWALSELNCRQAQKARFERGSYKLRQALLELRRDFSSFDVFSRTLFVQRLSNVPYLAEQKHWLDERVGLQARLIANTHILARSLSLRMPTFKLLQGNADETGIVGVRGNTASGKSSSLGIKEGVLNTDPIKWGLRKGTQVRNRQIHHEGAMLFDRYFKDLERDPGFKYVMDLRFISISDLKYYLFEPAKLRQCPVMLKDLDIPLLTSLNRVLKRDPRGEDPIPALEPIVDGFRMIRANRNEVIASVIAEEVVKEYQLFHSGRLIAFKEDGKFTIIDQEAYVECIASPSALSVEADLERIIDEDYILESVSRGDLKEEEISCLERWKGMTVRAALDKHANT